MKDRVQSNPFLFIVNLLTTRLVEGSDPPYLSDGPCLRRRPSFLGCAFRDLPVCSLLRAFLAEWRLNDESTDEYSTIAA